MMMSPGARSSPPNGRHSYYQAMNLLPFLCLSFLCVPFTLIEAAAVNVSPACATPGSPTGATIRVEKGLTVPLKDGTQTLYNNYYDLAASWDTVKGATSYRLCIDDVCHVVAQQPFAQNKGNLIKRVVFNPGHTIRVDGDCDPEEWPQCKAPYFMTASVRAENDCGGVSAFAPLSVLKKVEGTTNYCAKATAPGDFSQWVTKNVKISRVPPPPGTGTIKSDGVKSTWVDVKVTWDATPKKASGYRVCVNEKRVPWAEDAAKHGFRATDSENRNTCRYFSGDLRSAVLQIPIFADSMTHIVSVSPTNVCSPLPGGDNLPSAHLQQLYVSLIHVTKIDQPIKCAAPSFSANQKLQTVACTNKNSLKFVSQWDADDWEHAKFASLPFTLQKSGTNSCLIEEPAGTVSMATCKKSDQSQNWTTPMWGDDYFYRVINVKTKRCISLDAAGIIITEVCKKWINGPTPWDPDSTSQTWTVRLSPFKQTDTVLGSDLRSW
eukprot:comp22548_c0_seq1/m.34289 comp22548_c0_seq1/g.34289  ORF comp22548_c0_seq1/g.34289 comp22548_c0_seq1/m.34289 type:complete len:492 (-) comp22548_c0_seq1:94-1569(-)